MKSKITNEIQNTSFELSDLNLVLISDFGFSASNF